jgi:hypothetical protein
VTVLRFFTRTSKSFSDAKIDEGHCRVALEIVLFWGVRVLHVGLQYNMSNCSGVHCRMKSLKIDCIVFIALRKCFYILERSSLRPERAGEHNLKVCSTIAYNVTLGWRGSHDIETNMDTKRFRLL